MPQYVEMVGLYSIIFHENFLWYCNTFLGSWVYDMDMKKSYKDSSL